MKAKMNKVDVIEARCEFKEYQLGTIVEKRNAEGWSLVGSITTCLLNGGYTYFIATWERETPDPDPIAEW